MSARIGRSEVIRDLALEELGLGFGVAGLRLKSAGSFDRADIKAAHTTGFRTSQGLGYDPDCYAILDRNGSLEVLVPERPCKSAYENATALGALGLESRYLSE